MQFPLNLGDRNSRWTTDQEIRLAQIVYSEFGLNYHYLDDNEIEALLDQVEIKYNVGHGKERSRNGLRARLRKLRTEIHLHIFQEYERIRRRGCTYIWEGTLFKTVDFYMGEEIDALDKRNEEQNPPLKLFVRHEEDKKNGYEDLVAAGFVGLDWVLEGETAYYVTPKIQDIDYAQMFVDVFTLGREDNFSEWRKLINERKGMYRIDFVRRPIPISKKHQYLGVSIFTELLLVHLVDMTWIMTLACRFDNEANPWNRVRDLLQRARMNSLIPNQAENVILKFLEAKENDAAQDILFRNHENKANPDDAYGGDSYDEYCSLLDALERILPSSDDVYSQDLFIPPFRIDMPKLFELYFYYLLARMDNETIKPYIRYQVPCPMSEFDGLSRSGNPKPDFLIADKGLLIDAKYKVDYNEESHYSASDVRQLLSYTRLKTVVDICRAKGEIKTIIAFSSVDSVPVTDSLQDLYDTHRSVVKQNPDAIELYKCAIPLPMIR